MDIENSTPKWILLPGMGATSAMYADLFKHLDFDIHVLDWPEYKGETTFHEVAQRIINENVIRGGDVVGGSSLGGMISIEIAKLVKLQAVVLIGSACRVNEIRHSLLRFSTVAKSAPIKLIQQLAILRNNLVSEMFAGADPEFMRAMIHYLPSWQGSKNLSSSLFRIHGKRDHLISCPESDCETIENGGHLIAMTHVKEVAAFIKTVQRAMNTNTETR